MARRSRVAKPAPQGRLNGGSDGEIVLLMWTDYVGLARCRGVPADQFKSRHAHGLGWAVAGQALTPFEDIAPNPWGPMTEVRQTPVLATQTRIAIWDDAPAFHFALCDALIAGESWDCCVRGFLRTRLPISNARPASPSPRPSSMNSSCRATVCHGSCPFRWSRCVSWRLSPPMSPAHFAPPQSVLKRSSPNMVSASMRYPADLPSASPAPTAPSSPARSSAKRRAVEASAPASPRSPRRRASATARMCISAGRHKGVNRTLDAKEAATLSRPAQHFTAGVVRYMPEFCALVAPSPVSYLRLGPHHWSCGYAGFGVHNREATIRSCPSPDPKRTRKASISNYARPMPRRAPIWCSAPWCAPASKASARSYPCRLFSTAIPPIIPTRRGQTSACGRCHPRSARRSTSCWAAHRLRLASRSHARVLCRGEAQGNRNVCSSDARGHVQEVS